MKDSDSSHSTLISECMKEGMIVPSLITVQLILHVISSSEACKFIIDGFPRNLENLTTFQQELLPHVSLLGLVYFECDMEIMLKRIEKRAATSGRTDDNSIDSLKKRFQTFQEETLPVISYFQNTYKNVYQIEANKSFECVSSQLKELFRSKFILDEEHF
eukprot:TRINITY_DN4266_c0_g1_i10.p1 TRINITY_DN4266_c0_g1~~TRINITY_DN4266_c0_g1_i10.p1  ORF type:complete len:160 (-),score=32.63 TRINITY_DN4266_c0_g1_i10:157-636(-)